MWGHRGDWPPPSFGVFDLDYPLFFALRRVLRRYNRSKRRLVKETTPLPSPASPRPRKGGLGGTTMAQRRALSAMRGVSTWLPAADQFRLLEYLGRDARYQLRDAADGVIPAFLPPMPLGRLRQADRPIAPTERAKGGP